MAPPRVSVVIPTYNRADLLQRAIDSVLAQTFEDYEAIVVDDASTDETRAVVQSIDDDRIEYIRHEENRHGAAARNTGIEAARGEYVAFLDDDDEWYPEKIAKQVAVMDEAPESVALVYCWSEVYDGEELVNVRQPELAGEIFEETLTGNPIGGTPTLLVRRSVLEAIDGFDEDLRRGQDSDLVRRIAQQYHVDYVPEALIKQRWKHEGAQIRDAKRENLYDSIHARTVTLDKFSDYLAENPLAKARIYREIAVTYAQTRDWVSCLHYTGLMIHEAPSNPTVYRGLRPILGHVKAELVAR